jgi:hypothetical protein
MDSKSKLALQQRELVDWKEEARRKDTIIMSLTQRIPELEPAQEPRESPQTASEPRPDAQAPREEERPVPWWRRFF